MDELRVGFQVSSALAERPKIFVQCIGEKRFQPRRPRVSDLGGESFRGFLCAKREKQKEIGNLRPLHRIVSDQTIHIRLCRLDARGRLVFRKR